MIPDRVVVGAERHGDRHPMPGRGHKIDLVVADAQPCDDLEAGGLGEHPLVVGLGPAMVAITPSSRWISSFSVKVRPRSFQRISNPASTRGAR